VTLPKELAPIATRYRGPGCVIYPKRLDPPSTQERMDELVAEGWLSKVVRAYYDDDTEYDFVEQDPETEQWYGDGDPIPESAVVVSYLTTEKTHDMKEAKIAILLNRMGRATGDLGEMLESAKALEAEGLDVAFALRVELAKLALDAPMGPGVLERYVEQLRSHK
jgi:hypothetical protein